MKIEEKINEHYFDRRRRTEKEKRTFYYILGAWYAGGSCIEDRYDKVDGSVSTYRSVRFQNKNRELVQIVINELEYVHDLKYHKSPKAKDRQTYWFDAFGVDSLCDRLEELGAVSKDKREFPKIPKKYIGDFIRGFLDAAGYLYVGAKKMYLVISFNSKYMKGLREALEKYAHVKGGGGKKNNLVYCIADIAKIYDLIYREKGLRLSNKKKQMKKAKDMLNRVPLRKQLQERKILRAAKVLENGGTVTKAASVAGYTHITAIYESFKKVMGVSVMEYRNQFR